MLNDKVYNWLKKKSEEANARYNDMLNYGLESEGDDY